jgi:cation transport ATPase
MGGLAELVFATRWSYGAAAVLRAGWRSIVNRHLNMFTLIMLGVGAAYVFSAVAVWRRASSPRRSATKAATWGCISRRRW